MGFILKKVELSNIRLHKHVIFEPASEGVTVVHGANGTGKSTIIDSIPWVLYGTKPKGVSKASALIRAGIDFSKEKVFARVWFDMEGVELKMERRIVTKAGAVECDVWERANQKEEFKHVAGPSVSHADAYVKKRFQMDENGFLTAVIVQQKQVDQIISAGPRERADVIERLTGITSITRALTAAKEEHNQLKKVLKALPTDHEELDKLRAEFDSTTKAAEQHQLQQEKLSKNLSKIREDYDLAQAKLTEEEARSDEVEELNTVIVKSQASLEALNEEFARVSVEKDAKKKQLEPLSSGTNLKSLEKDVSNLKATLRKNDAEVARMASEKTAIEARVVKAQAIIDNAKTKTLVEASERLTEVKESRLRGETMLAETKNEVGELNGSIRRLNSAIKVIGEGDCPTCLQRVSDVAAAVASLEEEHEKLSVRLAEARKKISATEIGLERLRASEGSLEVLIEAIKFVSESAETLSKMTEDSESISRESVTVDAELTAIEKVYAAAKRSEEIKSEYDAFLNRTVKISDEIERLTGLITNTNKKLSSLRRGSKDQIPTLRAKVTKLTESLQEATESFGKVRESVSVSKANLSHLEEKIERMEADIDRYQKMLEDVETSGKTVEVIEEFRQNRIKTAIPAVSTFASELFSRFTDNKYTQLNLDEKFNTTAALADGTLRPVGLLSGGELSAAAIALRISISMLLNGEGARTMQAYDEVLVSQDAERAQQILNVVKEKSGGQLIMVSHGSYTTDIADKIFELSKN